MRELKFEPNVSKLPEFKLFNDDFLLSDIESFHDLCRYVHSLPYGRNSNRHDFSLVLKEKCGTCSSKHAFLASVAQDHGQDVDLFMGIFLMNGTNTPKLQSVLGHENVPEAHCYLFYDGVRVDFTHAEQVSSFLLPVLNEDCIRPEDVTSSKSERHFHFVKDWCLEKDIDFDKLWSLRETCIKVMSES